MLKMASMWDSYWERETNHDYWLQPDKAVIELVDHFDRIRMRDALDLGCGVGRHTLPLVDAGFNVTAVDSSSRAISILQNRAREKGLIVNAVQGDYSDDLFPEESFDFILAFNVLYHGYRKDFQNAVCLIHKWLRPDGLFFFTCPTRRDDKFGSGGELAPNTFRPLNSIHPGDIHYFADEGDIKNFLSGFNEISRKVNEHYWDNDGVRQFSSYWQVVARKQNPTY